MQKGYIETQGQLSYRDCEIDYYTYKLCGDNKNFHINVNVAFHAQNSFIISLPLDDSFEEEEQAVDFGIEQGKQFIDHSFEEGKFMFQNSSSNI